MERALSNHFIVFLCIVGCASQCVGAVSSGGVRCASFCDRDGAYRPSFLCNNTQFCCGDRFSRYCCTNKTLDISSRYPNDVVVQDCHGNAWLLYHWQLLLGTMGIMMTFIVVAACCCQCCSTKKNTRMHRRNRTRNRTNTDISIIDIPDIPQNSFFDPSHPYAFTPPEYGSLTKDPPAYSSIFGLDGISISNPAFEDTELLGQEVVGSSGGSNNTQQEAPPEYKEHDETPSGQSQSEGLQSQATTSQNSTSELQDLTSCGPSSSKTISSSKGPTGKEDLTAVKITGHECTSSSSPNCTASSPTSGSCSTPGTSSANSQCQSSSPGPENQSSITQSNGITNTNSKDKKTSPKGSKKSTSGSFDSGSCSQQQVQHSVPDVQ